MSLLIFVQRKINIIHRLNAKNYQLNEIVTKLSDLTSYSNSIGDGTVSMSDMMHAPGSMLGRMMMFAQFSHNAAIQMTQQQMQDAAQAAKYQSWVQNCIYHQAREYLGKMEARTLNEQEKKLQKEKVHIETEIRMLEQELQSVERAEESGIKSWAPKYV